MTKFRVFASVVLAVWISTAGQAGAVESYKLGQKAPSGDLVFVVHGFQDPYTSPNQFVQPDAGKRYVVVDVEVINKKTEQQSWSYLLGSELILKDRQTFDGTFALTGPPAPDGEIPAKFSKRGLILFEVPIDAQVQFIRLKGNINASGALVRLNLPKTPVAPAP